MHEDTIHGTVGEAVGEDVVYRANRAQQLRKFIAGVLLGAFLSVPFFDPHRPPLSPGQILAFLGCPMLGLLALYWLANAIFQRPRLTLGRSGIELQTLWRTASIEWDSIGPFTPNFYRNRLRFASAPIIGPSASANLRRRKKVTIGDSYTEPLGTILGVIEARRQSTQAPVATDWSAVARERETRYGVEGFRMPWATFAICAVLALVFAVEVTRGLDPTGPMLRPSVKTLLSLGALNRELVEASGEWHRVFTAVLLHGDINHLLLNLVALLMVGYLLERVVGRAWFLAIFVLGGVAGSLMSMAINPKNLTSVGASGAIMALFAAALVSSFRLPSGTNARTRMMGRSIQVLIPSLLPLATNLGANGTRVDYGAHLGGALAGLLVGFLLLKTWPEEERLPPRRVAAAWVAVGGIALFASGAISVVLNHDRYSVLAGLIPLQSMPRSLDDIRARGDSLAAAYPDDPRAHMFRASALYGTDNGSAESEMRRAIEEAHALGYYFGGEIENSARVSLALMLLADGKKGDVPDVVRPACDAPPEDRPAPALYQGMIDNKLCDQSAISKLP